MCVQRNYIRCQQHGKDCGCCRIDGQCVTIPPASEVNADFMQVGEMIQQHHIAAFQRLAHR